MKPIEQEWIGGDITLGAAAKWSADEIRLVTELGYALAQQGRNAEAIVVFDGLSALAPATHYFDSALGALWLREADYEKALTHLNSALDSDPEDITNRVNRAEVLINLNQNESAVEDLNFVLDSSYQDNFLEDCATRAGALLTTLSSK